jgi:hypothetical protein
MAEVVDVTDFKSAVRDEKTVGSSSGNGSLDGLNTAVKMHKRYNFTSLFAMFVVVGASVSNPSLQAMKPPECCPKGLHESRRYRY